MQIQFIGLVDTYYALFAKHKFMLCSNKEMQLNLHMQLNKRTLNIRIKENGHKFSVIRLTFLHVLNEIYAV